jgi:hypothetical protein
VIRDVHYYFQQAMRRQLGVTMPGALRGPLVHGAEGLCAGFRVRIENGRIVKVDYRSTTCTTLVALCEHLSEAATGLERGEAARLSAAWLLEQHPEVAPERQDRAALAAAALQAALQREKS